MMSFLALDVLFLSGCINCLRLGRAVLEQCCPESTDFCVSLFLTTKAAIILLYTRRDKEDPPHKDTKQT